MGVQPIHPTIHPHEIILRPSVPSVPPTAAPAALAARARSSWRTRSSLSAVAPEMRGEAADEWGGFQVVLWAGWILWAVLALAKRMELR